jgi:hypothetical protein
MKRILIGSAVLVTVLSSCHGWFGHRIRGNGNITTENRSVSGFTGVDVSGAINIYIKQDSAPSVKIETDANLMEYIVTRVEGGVLHIYPGDHANLDATGSIKVYVSGNNFKSFEASGACDIYGQNKITTAEAVNFHITGASKAEMELNSPKVSGDLSGASDLKLSGETKELVIDASGASSAKCFDLMAENADIDVSGASNVSVFASVKLKAGASGASEVKYKGNAVADINSSGASSVKKVE